MTKTLSPAIVPMVAGAAASPAQTRRRRPAEATAAGAACVMAAGMKAMPIVRRHVTAAGKLRRGMQGSQGAM